MSHEEELTWMPWTFFLPLSSRLRSLRAARSAPHVAPPTCTRGGLAPRPAVAFSPDTGDGSGDQSRCTKPGAEKPETPVTTHTHTHTFYFEGTTHSQTLPRTE